MQPKVSIIVPVYNEEKMLPICLDALMNINYPKDRLEIIVVDNNSADMTASIIKSYPVKYIFEEKRNRSVARSKGIKIASGELIAFTDADGIVDKDWIQNLIKCFENNSIGGCGGKTLGYKPENAIEKYLDWFLFKKQFEKTGNFYEDFFVGLIFGTHNVMYRSKVLKEVGLFDETMMASEDIDLVWRVCLKGYQVNYTPDAVVYHKRKATLKDFLMEIFEYTYWQYFLLERYERIIGLSFNWPKYFLKILQSPANFFLNLFNKEDKQPKIYPLLNSLWNIATLITGFYGWLKLKSGKNFSSLPFIPGKILWRREGNGEVMILNLVNKVGYYLNGAGARIWEMFTEGKGKNEIADIINKEYEIEDATRDVVQLIEDFEKEGLISLNSVS